MGKSGRAKARKGQQTHAIAKIPGTPSTNTSRERPVFCFQYADRATPHPWRFTGDSHGAELINRFCEFAALTWGDIERQRTGGKSRHRKHHGIEVSSLVPDAQSDLMKRQLTERFGDSIFRFRFGGEQRLWGFRSGATFHVVWWDPDHEVCKNEKRHT